MEPCAPESSSNAFPATAHCPGRGESAAKGSGGRGPMVLRRLQGGMRGKVGNVV